MAMAINVILIIVCLFLIAQYLEGTLHKGSQLGCRQKGFKEFQRDMIKAMKHFDIHIYIIYMWYLKDSQRGCVYLHSSVMLQRMSMTWSISEMTAPSNIQT